MLLSCYMAAPTQWCARKGRGATADHILSASITDEPNIATPAHNCEDIQTLGQSHNESYPP